MAEEQKDELKEQLAKSLAFLKVGAKNFLHLKGIARDLNVASQNIQLLLKAVGGEPRKSGQTDMHILTPDQIDKKLEVDVAKATVVPKETEEEKKPSLVGKAFDKLKSSKAGKAVGERNRGHGNCSEGAQGSTELRRRTAQTGVCTAKPPQPLRCNR